MTLRLGWKLCLIGLILNPLTICSAQNAQIQVQTLRCDAGYRFHPTDVSVTAFDADKIPEILNAYRDFQSTLANLNDDAAAVEAADKLSRRVEKLISSTPALVRRRRLSKSPSELSIPRVKRVVIFGILETEYDPLPNFAEVEVSPDSTKAITLSFSPEADCAATK